MNSESSLGARSKSVNSNKLISKYLEYIEVSKKVSGAAILQSKIMTHNPHIKCA